jgi:uncharacterized OB-fold protein
MEQERAQEAPPVLAAHTWIPPAGEGERPVLLGSRCPQCGRVWFPRLRLCPDCLAEAEPQPLGPRGVLYSFSVVHVGPKGLKTPYAVGYVDLPEGVRVFAHLEAEGGALRPGMEMECTWGPVRQGPDGRWAWGYKFRPVA